MLKKLNNFSLLLLVIGGLVWGLFGLYRINVIEYVFARCWFVRIVYILFGVAVIYHLIFCKTERKKRKAKR